eukprot:scaffold6705_cov134-Isochrysis_galbana.AAC.8
MPCGKTPGRPQPELPCLTPHRCTARRVRHPVAPSQHVAVAAAAVGANRSRASTAGRGRAPLTSGPPIAAAKRSPAGPFHQGYAPPFVPALDASTDTRYFDETFTSERVEVADAEAAVQAAGEIARAPEGARLRVRRQAETVRQEPLGRAVLAGIGSVSVRSTYSATTQLLGARAHPGRERRHWQERAGGL